MPTDKIEVTTITKMKLIYRAATSEGKIVHGILEAKDTAETVAFLRRKGLIPITIKKESTSQDIGNLIPFLSKYKLSDLILFTRQLSSMLSSGLTLVQALQILQNQMQKSTMREIISKVIADIEEGKRFAQAIAKYPEVFSPIYVSLIKAGESSGFLDKILQRLATNLEKQQQLRSTLRSAMIYPTIVVVLMVVVMSLMMIIVVPQLAKLYEGLNVSLPLTTQIVIAISNFMVSFWWVVLLALFGITFAYKKWNSTPSGKRYIDSVKLRIPVFGKLISQSIIVEFSRTFGLLMASGALVTTSLQETAGITGNTLYSEAIMDIASDVEKGITIGKAIGSYTLFPTMVVEMVKLGEQTGKLDEALLKVSEYFEREVETTIKNLTTLIEPFIMVVLGLGVAFLVLSIITPIYNLTNAIH